MSAEIMEGKNFKTIINAEEDHLSSMSTINTAERSSKSRKHESSTIKLNLKNNPIPSDETPVNIAVQNLEHVHPTIGPNADDFAGKTKVKKSKKREYDNKNISVKSSFNKFDALQKINTINNPQSGEKQICRICQKPVYKMEEVKAEKNIYHKNCLRCQECSKQLKLDNYESHEGSLYCAVHFKLLFAPKVVEELDEKPQKPELIIRESLPTELPPDVARASDKPSLGLEELGQLNLRSKFQVFENVCQKKIYENEQEKQNSFVKRSTSILQKLAKLQQHGLNTTIDGKIPDSITIDKSVVQTDYANIGTSTDDCSVDDNDEDAALLRSKKRTQTERPIGLGDAMNAIKTKFEKGHVLSKEERREERKQEIQNIRSRLFLGKQAKIKELYQQAVADSEQGIVSVGKQPELEIEACARTIKEQFENGDAFKNKAELPHKSKCSGLSEDADVFESAISKRSRSIFLELDANVSSSYTNDTISDCVAKSESLYNLNKIRSKFTNSANAENIHRNINSADVVKYDEKPDDVKIATREISEKYKFFESYQPTEGKKPQFRMTPPREGVVKMPSPDTVREGQQRFLLNDNVLHETQTTSSMLNKFREMEKNKYSEINEPKAPKPLKSFTPPPEDGYCCNNEKEDSESFSSDENEINNDEVSQNFPKLALTDDALKEAQMAARAKKLRLKFEKWQTNEIQRELSEGKSDAYSHLVSDNSTIESTKLIREKFENLKNCDQISSMGPRYKVNRFL